MREFEDAHAEYKETKSEEARLHRQRAMHSDSPEIARRMGERMATELVDEKNRRREAERKRSIQPWQRKEE